MIFIIGTGRSGIHWVGYILQSHPDIYVSIEKPALFKPVTTMALNPKLKITLFPKVVEHYRNEYDKTRHKYYADKSHPNLWHTKELANHFPQALFVGIQRNPYATVEQSRI